MLTKLDLPDAQVYLQGAHLTRFKDWLFLSSASHFETGRAIRGGIPVVFPYFGPKAGDADAPQHGWARTSEWEVGLITLNLFVLDMRRDEWKIEIRFEFSSTLQIFFSVRNEGKVSRSFECALHTYFAVSDIEQIQIEGLDGREFIAKSRGGVREVQHGPIRFAGEVDWVFPDAPSPILIRDGASGYELRGDWNSAVVWNPWSGKAATMSDVGQDEWKQFVCVEVGAVAEGTIELPAGESWHLQMEVSRL